MKAHEILSKMHYARRMKIFYWGCFIFLLWSPHNFAQASRYLGQEIWHLDEEGEVVFQSGQKLIISDLRNETDPKKILEILNERLEELILQTPYRSRQVVIASLAFGISTALTFTNLITHPNSHWAWPVLIGLGSFSGSIYFLSRIDEWADPLSFRDRILKSARWRHEICREILASLRPSPEAAPL